MPATLSDTLAFVGVVHDTLTIHKAVAVHDTLSQFVGRMPEFARVADTIGPKDWWSWGIQAFVALTAAFLGAIVGGRQARLGSREALHEEWKLDRRTDLERMRDRIQSNLQRLRTLAATIENHNPDERFSVTVADGLEVIWNTYYRVSEPIFSLGDSELSEALDALFTRARGVGVEIRALEDRVREIDSRTQEADYFMNTLEERQNLPSRRAAHIQTIGAIGAETFDLAARLSGAEL